MKLVYTGNFTAILLFLIFIVIFFSTYASEEPLFHQTRFLGEVTKIVDALKESGADPIVLQIDCLLK